MVDEKKLLEIFKQKHFQGDSYYCRINNNGDKYIVGYKNDYPMQHGNGKEWAMPIEVAEMIAGQVEPEVKPVDYGTCKNCIFNLETDENSLVSECQLTIDEFTGIGLQFGRDFGCNQWQSKPSV